MEMQWSWIQALAFARPSWTATGSMLSSITEAEAAVLSAQRTAAGEVGSVRIGYNWSARFETLPALGEAFKKEHRPDVDRPSAISTRAQHGRPPLGVRDDLRGR
jgi:hypothetical protein